jgi:hypothetical protein
MTSTYLLRRSTDDGKTWSAPKSVGASVDGPKEKNPFALRMKNVDPKDVTYNNPVLIADKDGRCPHALASNTCAASTNAAQMTE